MFKKVECNSRKGFNIRKKYRDIVAEELLYNKEINKSKEDIEDGFLYEKNSSYLALGNVSIAGITKYIFEDGQSCPLIVTDILFDELSETAKRFTILHEIGHFVNKDLENPANFTGRDLKKELKADEHALTEMTIEEVISSLKEYRDLIKLVSPYAYKEETYVLDETNMRIKHFEKML